MKKVKFDSSGYVECLELTNFVISNHHSDKIKISNINII